MTEYWISHAKQKEDNIEQVRAFINTVEGIKYPTIYKREDIIKSLEEDQDKWYTCLLKDKKGQRRIWKKASEINTIETDGEKYLRIDEKKEKKDHLGKLPSLKEDIENTKPKK
jgi:hypothetical protein